ncbi:MAG TPA: glutamine amidotransferase [Phycisphaerales bacterium]|nr:glutamine amidotransferase [Phycisphaerales bacterium]
MSLPTPGLLLASLRVGPIQFDLPAWLWAVPVCWALALWMSRRSIAGLGMGARRVALAVRLLVIALIVLALARPAWRRQAENVTVVAVVDTSRSVSASLQAQAESFLRAAAQSARPGDELAKVAVARDAIVQSLPAPPAALPDTQQLPEREATNLAEGVRMGMAVGSDQTANRLLIVSDGNETAGSLLLAAEAARAAGIPIDVLPLKYTHDREVVVERLVAPSTARMGQPVNLRAVISATAAARGRVTLQMNGEAVDLDPGSDALGISVELEPGVNPLTVPVMLPSAGPQTFEVVFEPTPDESGRTADAVPENNRALAVTFVSGEGRVLVVAERTEEAEALVAALTQSRIGNELRTPAEAPVALVDLAAYDAVVLVNVPSYALSQAQQEHLRQYVHDLGGGLVMTGGPDSFGAGAWIGSPLADALPVKLDPPQKRQMPRGALVLVMHSCEMPEGNYWGKLTATAAISNLSRQDLAGIVEYSWNGGDIWAHEMAMVGDGTSHKRAINNLSLGDAPSFATMMQMAITALEAANAGQKHCIIISDGDPQPPSRATLQRFIDAKVTVSCVLVFPHSGYEIGTMRDIATATKGNYYAVTQNHELDTLPDIFIKEAQTVRRSLIWEGAPFAPAVAGAPEAMRGFLDGVPAISGYVVTAEREGLSQVSLRGQENDPILASWQYGLGKSIAFTSDLTTRWAADWVSWAKFRAFWDQHLRWVMRPGGSADIRLSTAEQGDTTRVIVEALDADGERLDFVRFAGRAVGPDGKAETVELRQVGPGRYEGALATSLAGAYVMSFRYEAPPERAGEPPRTGVIQAAVTRPFADEFRALKDNYALLETVARKTGGRVLSGDPTRADLFARAGLSMPVALTPIWMRVALAALSVFLLDVAVRRVRIDVRAMARVVARWAGRETTQRGGEQMGDLMGARARARQAMAGSGAPEQPGVDGAPAGALSEPIPLEPAGPSASARFEAGEDELRAAARRGGIEAAGGEAGAGTRPAPAKPAGPATSEEGLSRLRQAKRRAREEMEDQ